MPHIFNLFDMILPPDKEPAYGIKEEVKGAVVNFSWKALEGSFTQHAVRQPQDYLRKGGDES